MKKTKLSILIVSSLLLSHATHAGFFKMTVHSRANCINNESITWWDGHPHTWRVVSTHQRMGGSRIIDQHTIDTDFMYNYRVAAVHWGEGNPGGWVVYGYHFDYDYSTRYPFAGTYATDCDIGNGW